jgi:hypothetical protein
MLPHAAETCATSMLECCSVDATREDRAERGGGGGMKTDGTETDGNPISTFVFIYFFYRNEKCGFENRIGICGYTETDKYGWKARKLN